jgi:NTE family protein
LAENGHDLMNDLHLVVGTSAGSSVGAQILSGVPLAQLYNNQLAEEHSEISPRIDLELLAIIFGDMALGGTSSDEQRARIGHLALTASTVDEVTRRSVIEARLPSHDWPSTPLVLTAIDADTGEFVTWDKHSNISLVDAVTSSCAVPSVWPCVSINGRKYFDGGLRNSVNGYLAAGYSHVTVIAPMTGGSSPLVDEELDSLRADGAVVRVVNCDPEAIAAMGPNSLDPKFRRIAAVHGRRQGLAVLWE